jgi:hypothetical protein
VNHHFNEIVGFATYSDFANNLIAVSIEKSERQENDRECGGQPVYNGLAAEARQLR